MDDPRRRRQQQPPVARYPHVQPNPSKRRSITRLEDLFGANKPKNSNDKPAENQTSTQDPQTDDDASVDMSLLVEATTAHNNSNTTTNAQSSKQSAETDQDDDLLLEELEQEATATVNEKDEQTEKQDQDEPPPIDEEEEDLNDECVIVCNGPESDADTNGKELHDDSMIRTEEQSNKQPPHQKAKSPSTNKDPSAETKRVNRRRTIRKFVLKACNRFITLVFAAVVVSPWFSEELKSGAGIGFSDGQRPNRQRMATRHEEAPATTTNPNNVPTTPATGETDRTLAEGGGNVVGLDARRKLALSFITEAVDKVGPSVVRIDTETDVGHAGDESEGQSSPLPQRPAGFVQQGQGSGLIISSDGLVLTNAHVVEHATRVSVTLTDGRVFSGKVTGSDEITDIACVQLINGQALTDLPVAELGDSDELQVGRLVIAVGVGSLI